MRIGLCASCAHVKVIENRRGSTFIFCTLSDHDSRFPRYPPLPVLHCMGYAPLPGKSPPSEPGRDRNG